MSGLSNASLDPRNVNVMQRFSKQTGIAAADYCTEKRLHLANILRQLGRNCYIISIESPIAFLPSSGLLAPKLSAKVFTNERMGIEMSRIVRIFSREESCSS